MKFSLYGTVVVCFAAAGLPDLAAGEWKLGVTALLFGAVNAVVFFWR